MPKRPDVPHRRHCLTLTLEADNPKALQAALAAIEYDLEVKTQEHDLTQLVDITSGGGDSSYYLYVKTDMSITGDAYKDALIAWRSADRAYRRALAEEAKP